MTWQEARISDLGRVVTGKTPSTKNPAFFDGEHPFVTPSDLDWRTYYCHETERTVSEEAREQHENQFIPENSTLVTCIGNTIGKCALSPSPCLTNQQINSIIPNDEFDARFVYYLMIYNVDQIRGVGLSGGAATPILNKTSFAALRIRVPSKPVRDEIGRLLSAYDDLIENNRRRMALLEEAARQLYREWFVRLRFPGHEHTRIIDGMPEGWERTTLRKLADFRLGKMLDANKNKGDLRPYLANKNVRWGEVDLTELREMRFEDHELDKYGLQHGDIIMCEGGEPGRCAIWKSQIPGMMYQKALHRIRPLNDLDHHFLYYSLYHKGTSGQMAGLFTGATIKHLPREKLALVELDIPPPTLMRQFADQIMPIERQRAVLGNAIERAAEARDLLLPRLMSGEIAV